MTTLQIWSCHVTLAKSFESFYFSPNSILNFRNVTKFGGNWLKNNKVTGKKPKSGWKTSPPVLTGLTLKELRGRLFDPPQVSS